MHTADNRWDVIGLAYMLARRESSTFTSWDDVAASWPKDRFGERSTNAMRQQYSILTSHGGNGKDAERERQVREVFGHNPVKPWFRQSTDVKDWFIWCIDTGFPGLVRPSED